MLCSRELVMLRCCWIANESTWPYKEWLAEGTSDKALQVRTVALETTEAGGVFSSGKGAQWTVLEREVDRDTSPQWTQPVGVNM